MNERIREDQDPVNSHQFKKQKLSDYNLVLTEHQPTSLPKEILTQEIIPKNALDWIFISKELHNVAFDNLIHDQRVPFTINSIRKATIAGCVRAVDLHLKHPNVDPNIVQIAIEIAAAEGHYNLVEILLKDPRAHPIASAVAKAAYGGHKEIVQLLIDDPRLDLGQDSSDYDYRSYTAIRRAVEKRHFDIVDLLLKDGRFYPEGALREAIGQGDYDMVQLLMADTSVDPSEGHNAALRAAVELGHKDIVTFLLEDVRVDPAGSDLDSDEETVYDICILKGNFEMMKLLLGHPRTDKAISVGHSIIMALEVNCYSMVKDILTSVQITSISKSDFQLAMEMAADAKQAEIVRLLQLLSDKALKE